MENWDDLRIFLTVAQSGSLTVAAQVLKIDPATVSRRIARLEHAHSTPLFSKSPKGYDLTEAHPLLWADKFATIVASEMPKEPT